MLHLDNQNLLTLDFVLHGKQSLDVVFLLPLCEINWEQSDLFVIYFLQSLNHFSY
jgi:hypothetical protein